MKRHKEALGIQQGARNVRAIARSLLDASDEAAREGVGAEQDAAVRMIVHQLAQVCKVDEIKYGFDPSTLKDVYCTLMAECEERAREISVKAERAQEKIAERLPTVTTVEQGDTVAVVLQEHGVAAARKLEEDAAENFSGTEEPRRGFLSRFLFRGEG